MLSINLLIVAFNYFLFVYFDVSKQLQKYLQVSGIMNLIIVSIFFAINNYFTIKTLPDKLIEGQKKYPLYETQKRVSSNKSDHLFDDYLKNR